MVTYFYLCANDSASVFSCDSNHTRPAHSITTSSITTPSDIVNGEGSPAAQQTHLHTDAFRKNSIVLELEAEFSSCPESSPEYPISQYYLSLLYDSLGNVQKAGEALRNAYEKMAIANEKTQKNICNRYGIHLTKYHNGTDYQDILKILKNGHIESNDNIVCRNICHIKLAKGDFGISIAAIDADSGGVTKSRLQPYADSASEVPNDNPSTSIRKHFKFTVDEHNFKDPDAPLTFKVDGTLPSWLKF